MSSKPRGFAIIINNEYFRNLTRREGTVHDLTMLRDLFRTLQFTVETYSNLQSDVSFVVISVFLFFEMVPSSAVEVAA